MYFLISDPYKIYLDYGLVITTIPYGMSTSHFKHQHWPKQVDK